MGEGWEQEKIGMGSDDKKKRMRMKRRWGQQKRVME